MVTVLGPTVPLNPPTAADRLEATRLTAVAWPFALREAGIAGTAPDDRSSSLRGGAAAACVTEYGETGRKTVRVGPTA